VSQAGYDGPAYNHRSIVVFISRREVWHRHTPSGDLMITRLPPQHNSRQERRAKRRDRHFRKRWTPVDEDYYA
jgi:hypothetical protein